MSRHYFITFFGIFLLFPQSALACDLCAVHNLLVIDEGEVHSWSSGVSEQLSSYGTVQQSDNEIENPSEQYLRSSVTQFTLGYKPFERVGLQATAPLIYRRFRRVEEGETDDGSVGGLGDISLLARVQPFRHESRDATLSLTVFGGIKLPTGDTSRLGEHEHTDGHGSDDEGHDNAARHEEQLHEREEVTAIHGHDLALGSGSFDLISGVSAMARYKRVFLSGYAQYALRSKGSYHYRFGDDFLWAFGPGVYLELSDEQIIILRTAFSGEAKGRDIQDGNKENDTGIVSYFVGPEAAIVLSSKLRLEAGVDIPLEIKNTGTQAAADYRLRGAVSYRF